MANYIAHCFFSFQWQDLLELFLHMNPQSHKSSGMAQLQSASSHLMEVMDSIHGDTRLLSLLSKGRGRKGVRDLQGPELKKKLKTIQQCLVHNVSLSLDFHHSLHRIK